MPRWQFYPLLLATCAVAAAFGWWSAMPPDVGPLGVWLVTTKFPDGRVLVSTCHTETRGHSSRRMVVCEPPLPFPAPVNR